MMPHAQHRNVTKNRTRSRRFYVCHRHPNHPVTGFCALCLRDRLAGLEDSSSSAPAPAPEFRRSKSVAGERCKDVSDFAVDLRRNSCDVRVRARNTLSDLFAVHDSVKLKVIDRVASVESVKLGFVSKECGGIRVSDEDAREIRVSDDVIVHEDCEIRVLKDAIELNREVRVSDDDEVTQGDLKTMKEIIEMELKNNKRNLHSVFGQKLQKWRKKQKEKKQSRCIHDGIESTRSKLGQLLKIRDTQSEVGDYGFGRRSCDTEPRFSIDAHRLSVEDPRFSLDEHRASWDGYMIARMIPWLTPMLPVVDNMVLGPVNKGANATTMENLNLNLNLQMHSISEDGASSGGSAQSNSDCCSSSNRGSSSSSMMSSSTKTAGCGGDDVKSASNARVSPASDVVFQGTKLVITEKELKDWRLNSIKNNNNNNVESVSKAPNLTSKTSTTNIMNPSNELKKKVMSSRWKKVCNLWSHKLKLDDKNGVKKSSEHMTESRVEIGNSSAKLVRNRSSVNTRRGNEFVLDRNRSTRYSTSDIDSGLLRLYLTPFRNSRSKFVKSRAPPSMVTNGLQLH